MYPNNACTLIFWGTTIKWKTGSTPIRTPRTSSSTTFAGARIRTVIRFSDVSVNTGVDDARLRLELPPGVKLVHPLENLPPPQPGDPVGFK